MMRKKLELKNFDTDNTDKNKLTQKKLNHKEKRIRDSQR